MRRWRLLDGDSPPLLLPFRYSRSLLLFVWGCLQGNGAQGAGRAGECSRV